MFTDAVCECGWWSFICFGLFPSTVETAVVFSVSGREIIIIWPNADMDSVFRLHADGINYRERGFGNGYVVLLVNGFLAGYFKVVLVEIMLVVVVVCVCACVCVCVCVCVYTVCVCVCARARAHACERERERAWLNSLTLFSNSHFVFCCCHAALICVSWYDLKFW